MAAAGLYSIGYSFWEFGAPDWDRAKYFMLWGVAEDHANPIKIGLGKLKRNGAKFVSVNPVRTGYSAIADEWMPGPPRHRRPARAGAGPRAAVARAVRLEFLVRYTNAAWLVIDAPGTARDGLFLRDDEGQPLLWDQQAQAPPRWRWRVASAGSANGWTALTGDVSIAADGAPVVRRAAGDVADRRALSRRRSTRRRRSPSAAACPADRSSASRWRWRSVAFEQTIDLPIAWTDVGGAARQGGRPAGRHVCDARHLGALQRLPDLPRAAPDADAAGRARWPGQLPLAAPFPRPIPPPQLPENDAATIDAPDTPLPARRWASRPGPRTSLVDADGSPLRLDKAYSWESPIAAHGMMHMVIRNAVEGDPYPIDTLMLFMANMAWNSSMNTAAPGHAVREGRGDGEYRIPFIVVSDAFDSETVRFADLVLPDTTYLERFDAISLLDRPISEPTRVADAIRHPVLKPDRDVRPGRTCWWTWPAPGLAGLRRAEDAAPRYPATRTSSCATSAPGIGILAGWRGADGESSLAGRAEPEPVAGLHRQPELLRHEHWPRRASSTAASPTAPTSTEAARAGFIGKADPIVMQLYVEPLQKFRLAGKGLYDGSRPTRRTEDRERCALLRPAADLVSAARGGRGRDDRRATRCTRSRSARW
jgi:hypothetical protein